MDAASSRRKQSRPARIEDDDDVSEKSPPGTPHSQHHDENGGDGGSVPGDDRSESSPVEIRAAGSIMGPIRARRLASPLETTVGAIATVRVSVGGYGRKRWWGTVAGFDRFTLLGYGGVVR